jgi:hypothetical protein
MECLPSTDGLLIFQNQLVAATVRESRQTLDWGCELTVGVRVSESGVPWYHSLLKSKDRLQQS